jgi:phosphotransferase system HPr-like phosphotransfer protein
MRNSVTISRPGGVDLLTAARLARAVRGLRSPVVVRCGSRRAGARDVLGILALASERGAVWEIRAYGGEAARAAGVVADVVDPERKRSNGHRGGDV